MRITVKFFAILRDRAGVSELTVDLGEGATVAVALAALAEKVPVLKDWLSAGRVAYAVNRNYAAKDVQLNDGDELALIPPVSGGRF